MFIVLAKKMSCSPLKETPGSYQSCTNTLPKQLSHAHTYVLLMVHVKYTSENNRMSFINMGTTNCTSNDYTVTNVLHYR